MLDESVRPPTTTATGDAGAAVGTPKTLRIFDMVLFSVAAMLLLSQLTLSASIGPSAIFWTLAIIVVFFLPYGLVTAELGSTYPDAGGIYSWVVRAFGKAWGTRVSWWYWVNVGLWVPSVYLMFSGAISSMFFDGNLAFWAQVGITLVLIWINFWINIRSLEVGSWVSNAGAIITVVVIVALAVAGVVHMMSDGSATEWTVSGMLPTDALPAIALALPIIVYNFLGFELMSSASKDMENPKRDVPKAIGIAGILIGAFYLIATVGMLQIIPAEEISETTGLVDALKIGFGDSTLATVAVTVLGIGVLFAFFAALIPWTIGANLAAAESARQGDLPHLFARMHRTRRTPIGAALTTAGVGTAVVLVYGVLFSVTDGAIDDLFWSLFAFSSVIFLLPYIVMMLAFRKLRRIDPDVERPYRVPGGRTMVALITWVPVVLLGLAALFFVWNPFEFDGSFTAAILAGIAVAVIIQEVFVHRAPVWAAARAAEAVTAESVTAEAVVAELEN
jgi:amino acid transporter